MNDTAQYVHQIQAVADKLAAQGVETIFILLALAEVTVTTAARDPAQAPINLQGAAAVLSAAARGFQEPAVVAARM